MRRFSVITALLLLTACFGAARAAGTPQAEMHQQANQTPAADGTYPARSTKGHFSVVMPIPFNDFTVRTEDPNIGELVMHMIGAKTTDGFEISANEMVRTPRSKDPDLAVMVGGLAKQLGAGVPDVPVETAGDEAFISTVLDGSAQVVHYRISKTPASMFTVMCVYPKTPDISGDTANTICSDFVKSFKVLR
ncbi:hypothetical protein [Pararhizobium sp.]|uniref:hypothetical protein n=1 Tax=Pararhizobium sp. TaxID=1977563 RepID=UPI00271622DC|nr:hypothetical protein [Pararhizobium sp.]MDO9417235.1 hypothetical protein [Pararhizobium sp.]